MARLHSTFLKPAAPHILSLRVRRTARFSPNFMRVTLTGDDLKKFSPMGWDQWFRLFLPQDPTTEPRLPTATGARWWPQVLRMPAHERPHVRNYTVSGFREDDRELDVDFVMHGSEPAEHSEDDHSNAASVAADWAASAESGWPVGLLDQGIGWNPPAAHNRVLIVGDETALPAVAGIARDLPADAEGTIVVEIPDADDRRDLGQPDGVDVHWIVRDGDASRPGQRALATAISVATASGAPDSITDPDALCAYVSGEQALATGLRRALVSRGVPKSHITICGYWRL
jgi:NADPH-dependent ferric siderophore reductase